MVDLKHRYNRPPLVAEQYLYDHLLQRVDLDPPEVMIERFKALFIEAIGYPERDIALALDELAVSKIAEDEFRFILNRCCHILINRWQARSQLQTAIPKLVELFESAPSKPVNEISRAKGARQVRSLVSAFPESEQYLTLKRLARVIDGEYPADYLGKRPLGTLIRRYPYLYEHCLLSEDSSQDHQRAVQKLQVQAQHKFEVDLSQYVTYRVRRARLARQTSASTAVQTLRTVDNPTLLSDRELVDSLKQFSGRVDGSHTYRDMAHSFMMHTNHTRSYYNFKSDLYEYITASVDSSYGSRQFNKLLHEQLKGILPECDDKPVSDFLMVRTFSQLLNFLVIESNQEPQHFVFVDLISNLGPILTTGLLLKIVLLCRKVKPYLERRFSILFSHYETCAQEAVQWLVKVLETLNIALSVNFGRVNIPFI